MGFVDCWGFLGSLGKLATAVKDNENEGGVSVGQREGQPAFFHSLSWVVRLGMLSSLAGWKETEVGKQEE